MRCSLWLHVSQIYSSPEDGWEQVTIFLTCNLDLLHTQHALCLQTEKAVPSWRTTRRTITSGAISVDIINCSIVQC
jgi:hypothetical protein